MLVSALDPRWREVAASLRKGTLYVKMPREKVLLLVGTLSRVEEDLLQKQVEESPKSFVFSAPVEDWKEDLVTLKKVVITLSGLASLGIFRELITAIEAGLRNDIQVDWIDRVGGPPPGALEALEALEPQTGEPKLSLP